MSLARPICLIVTGVLVACFTPKIVAQQNPDWMHFDVPEIQIDPYNTQNKCWYVEINKDGYPVCWNGWSPSGPIGGTIYSFDWSNWTMEYDCATWNFVDDQRGTKWIKQTDYLVKKTATGYDSIHHWISPPNSTFTDLAEMEINQQGDVWMDGYGYLIVDSSWSVTFFEGIIRYHNGSFTVYNQNDSTIQGTNFKHMVLDHQGHPYVWSNAGIQRFDGSKWELVPGALSGWVRDMEFDKSGQLYAAVHHHLYKHDGASWSKVAAPDSMWCSKLAVAPDSALWVVFREGVYTYKNQQWQLIIDSSFTAPWVLDAGIHDIDFDPFGNTWIATMTGLFVYNPNGVAKVVAGSPPPETDYMGNPFPNPSVETIQLNYGLGEIGPAKVRLFDINGKLLDELVNSVYPAGNYGLQVDVSSLAAGTYILQMSTRNIQSTKRIVCR